MIEAQKLLNCGVQRYKYYPMEYNRYYEPHKVTDAGG